MESKLDRSFSRISRNLRVTLRRIEKNYSKRRAWRYITRLSKYRNLLFQIIADFSSNDTVFIKFVKFSPIALSRRWYLKVGVDIEMTKVIYKNAFYVYLHVDLLLLTMPMIYQHNIVVINYMCSSVKMTACLFIFTAITCTIIRTLFSKQERRLLESLCNNAGENTT